MRIVLLTAGVRGIGSYCINLYHVLRAQGHEVLLISERPWEKEPLQSFHQAKSFMLFGLAPIVYKPRDVTRAIEAFEPDLIHHHWPCGTMDILFGMVARLGVPYVVTIHVSIASTQHVLDKFWYHLFSRYIKWIPKARAVNCISEFVRRQLAERVALPHEQVRRIYAGINENTFHPTAGRRDESPDRPIQLLFVGQIMPEKGIDLLVQAFLDVSRARRDLRLSIVGQGPLVNKLRKLSEGNDAIRWVGFLKGQKAIAEYYASADATVLPTRWDEAFSLVPIESFGCGTPVIATARGGTPEQVTEGVTGYLLTDGSEAEIAERLRTLDLAELQAMRPACRRLVMERHTFEIMGARHEELYREVLTGSRR